MNTRTRPNLQGRRFGRLVVIDNGTPGGKYQIVRCQCDCGQEKGVRAGSLLAGYTHSCGCLSREILVARSEKHGKTNTPEYRAWAGMKNRCLNPHVPEYVRYGGRGISVCIRWLHSFENFLSDMGPRPSPYHSIDRKDNDGDYCPENCHWATEPQQANNRSNNHRITWNGQTHTIAVWARLAHMKPDTLEHRLKRGHSLEDALSTPVSEQGEVTL